MVLHENSDSYFNTFLQQPYSIAPFKQIRLFSCFVRSLMLPTGLSISFISRPSRLQNLRLKRKKNARKLLSSAGKNVNLLFILRAGKVVSSTLDVERRLSRTFLIYSATWHLKRMPGSRPCNRLGDIHYCTHHTTAVQMTCSSRAPTQLRRKSLSGSEGRPPDSSSFARRPITQRERKHSGS